MKTWFQEHRFEIYIQVLQDAIPRQFTFLYRGKFQENHEYSYGRRLHAAEWIGHAVVKICVSQVWFG